MYNPQYSQAAHMESVFNYIYTNGIYIDKVQYVTCGVVECVNYTTYLFV